MAQPPQYSTDNEKETHSVAALQAQNRTQAVSSVESMEADNLSIFDDGDVEDENEEINLYTDVRGTMFASNFINTMVRFRRDIHVTSELTDPDFLMNLPKKSDDLIPWMKSNYKVLKESNAQETFDQKALDRMTEAVKEGRLLNGTLEVLDDQFAFAGINADVVYGIMRNPTRKRLMVVFRGTFQQKDWIQDMKARAKDVEFDAERIEAINGNLEALKGLKKPKIHNGFHEYLFKRKQGHAIAKIDEILDQILTRLKDPRNEGFSLYITGHSLGGALATLLAIICAISEDTPKPVKLFTFASPHVGKSSFIAIHERLEQLGRLQHLRTTNNDDLTPQGLGGLGFRHVGVHLNLYRNAKKGEEPYSISSSKVKGFWDVRSNHMTVTPRWMLGKYGLEMHQLHEHYRRLSKSKSALKALTLDELYQEPDLRGW